MAGPLVQHEREDPLYVAKMHERCAAHTLSPLNTPTLIELFLARMQAANQHIGELHVAGAVIPGRKGEPLTQEAAQLKALQQQAAQLEKQGLGWLESLGVLGG